MEKEVKHISNNESEQSRWLKIKQKEREEELLDRVRRKTTKKEEKGVFPLNCD